MATSGVSAASKQARVKPKPALRPRKCAMCGSRFRPTRRGARYCSRQCRQRAWRERHHGEPRAKLSPATDPGVQSAVCAYCGQPFWVRPNKHTKYCKAGCRTMAARQRRAATIRAFSQYSRKPLREAEELAELPGCLKAMRVFLSKHGLRYDERTRSWQPALPADDSAL